MMWSSIWWLGQGEGTALSRSDIGLVVDSESCFWCLIFDEVHSHDAVYEKVFFDSVIVQRNHGLSLFDFLL